MTTGAPLSRLARPVLALLTVIYAVLALGFLLAPAPLQEGSPFALPGLSGRFLGSWCAFLAVVAGFAFCRNRLHEARLPTMVLFLWPLAAVFAGLRSFDDLQPPSRRLSYLVGAVALAVLAALAGLAAGRSPLRSSG